MILTPKKWAEFQHYKDRCPPWIKLHRDLLNNRDFMCLPLASKALAPLLWLLASESKDGSFNADIAELEFRLRISQKDLKEGIKPLIDKGFFIDASNTLAGCNQLAIPETETETKGEKEKTPRKRSDPIPVIAKPDDVDQQVWADWLQLRKAKKAPVTQTVLDGALEEAAKAGLGLDAFLRIWCRRGSQGLEASWLKPNELQQATGTAYSRHMEQRASELAPGVARRPQQPITLENEHVPILPSH